MSQAQLTGIVSRNLTTTDGTVTAKGAALAWADMDTNLKLLTQFVNMLGTSFNQDGSLNVPVSAGLIASVLPFVSPVGTSKWSPVDLSIVGGVSTGIVTPALNGLILVEANGQTLTATDYPALSALFQAKFNWANQPNGTFRVPDLRRMYLRGRDSVQGGTGNVDPLYLGGQITWDANGKPSQAAGTGAGVWGGESVKLVDTDMSHWHYTINTNGFFSFNLAENSITGGNVYMSGYWSTVASGGSGGQQWSAAGLATTSGGAPTNVPNTCKTSDVSGTAPAARTAHENRPPSVTGIFYIVAGYMVNGTKQ